MAELKDIPGLLDDFFGKVREQQKLNGIGLMITRTIKSRTRSWRDVDGKRFQDYSDSHKRRRVALGLAVTPRGKDVDSMLVMDPVDGMMQSIRETVSKDLRKVTVDITSAEKRKLAYYHTEGGVGKKGKNIRKFWGLSIEECNYIAKKFTTDAGEVLGSLVKAADLKN